MMWGNGMGMGLGMGLVVLFWVMLIIGLAVLVFVLVRVLGTGAGRPAGPTTSAGGRSRAREILEERYARGEISTEEYRERLDTLREGDR